MTNHVSTATRTDDAPMIALLQTVVAELTAAGQTGSYVLWLAQMTLAVLVGDPDDELYTLLRDLPVLAAAVTYRAVRLPQSSRRVRLLLSARGDDREARHERIRTRIWARWALDGAPLRGESRLRRFLVRAWRLACTPRHPVVVVGGGAAGLAAAHVVTWGLRFSPLRVNLRLLEARDRLGGRMWTVPTVDGQSVDLGASYVHAGMRNHPVEALARGAGVPIAVDAPGYSEGWLTAEQTLWLRNNRRMAEHEVRKVRRLLRRFQEFLHEQVSPTSTDRPLSDLIAAFASRHHLTARALADLRSTIVSYATYVSLPSDLSSVSLVDGDTVLPFDESDDDDECDEQQESRGESDEGGSTVGRCVGGGGAGGSAGGRSGDARQVGEAEASSIDALLGGGGYAAAVVQPLLHRVLAAGGGVDLSTVVRSVTPSVVSTDGGRGRYEVADVVLTLPVGVLASGDVQLEPPLSADQQTSLRYLRPGTENKLVLLLSKPLPLPPARAPAYCVQLLGCHLRLLLLQDFHKGPVIVAHAAPPLSHTLESLTDAQTAALADRLVALLANGPPPPPCPVLDPFFAPQDEADKHEAGSDDTTPSQEAADLPQVVWVVRTRWRSDPFARGSYTYQAPGAQEVHTEYLAAPTRTWHAAADDNVGATAGLRVLAGEACTAVHRQCVAGALESGVDAALCLLDDVTSRLGTGNTSLADSLAPPPSLALPAFLDGPLSPCLLPGSSWRPPWQRAACCGRRRSCATLEIQCDGPCRRLFHGACVGVGLDRRYFFRCESCRRLATRKRRNAC